MCTLFQFFLGSSSKITGKSLSTADVGVGYKCLQGSCPSLSYDWSPVTVTSSLHALSRRSFSKDVTTNGGGDSTKPPPSTGGAGGGKSLRGGSASGTGGDKRDGWQCPNCGKPCSNIDMFVCMYMNQLHSSYDIRNHICLNCIVATFSYLRHLKL